LKNLATSRFYLTLSDTFDEVKDCAKSQKILPYDFWVTLMGDTNTEALPTYESWLMDVDG
jgi:acyl-[acyl-carrier-protein] desaturase